MSISLGLIELKSTPPGIQTADEMLKAADVNLIFSAPTCPGKYVIIISGKVGPVKNAMSKGIDMAGSFIVTHHTIHNVNELVPPAIVGTADIKDIKAIGVIETISAIGCVSAASEAADAADIQLVDVRIARGLGGKGFLIMTGDVGAVKSGMNAGLNILRDSGEVVSSCVIPSPHRGIIENLTN